MAALLQQIGSLTLLQIWTSIYNPPDTPLKLAIVVIALVAQVPGLYRRWQTWRTGRRVVKFDHTLPKELNVQGKVLESPSLSSHEIDQSLLPAIQAEAYVTCYDPSTDQHIATLPLLSWSDISTQVDLADSAQPQWAKTSFAQRRSVLRSLRRWVVADMKGIVAVACKDTGKTRVDAVFGEILTTLSKIDWLVKYGETTLAPERRPGNLLLAHKISTVHHRPLGTVLALVSWNYSFHNVLSPILAALFAGNSVVVKCSEQVAWSSTYFINCVRSCLSACGHNPDLVQLVVCLPEVAGQLTRHPKVRHITFIGSESVGRKVAQAAAEMTIPTCIELGGKDPAVILPSANLDFFASTWMRGAFQSAGQNCIGIELFLVPKSLYPRFVKIMTARIKALRLGDDVGSLISSTPIARLEAILDRATKGGAKVITGGKRATGPAAPKVGSYFEPTLVTDVSLDMEIANEELFAPVMTVVPYDNVEEVVNQLRRSRFGLGASVYGAKREECVCVANQLQCGMVAVNDFGVFYLNQAMPFGGVKHSGHGRFGGPEGLRGLCFQQSVIEDRFFSTIRTSIPPPVDFPLPAGEKPWSFLSGLVWLVYGEGVERVKGVVGLIKASM